jgi:hypothetical protein
MATPVFESLSLQTDLSRSLIRILDYCGGELALYVLIENGCIIAFLLPAIVFAPRHFRSRLATIRPEFAKRKRHFVEERS